MARGRFFGPVLLQRVSLVLLSLIGTAAVGLGPILLLWNTPGTAFLTDGDLIARLVGAAAIVGGTFFGFCAYLDGAYRRTALITGSCLLIMMAVLGPL